MTIQEGVARVVFNPDLDWEKALPDEKAECREIATRVLAKVAAWLRERAREYRRLDRNYSVSRALEVEEIADELDPPKPTEVINLPKPSIPCIHGIEMGSRDGSMCAKCAALDNPPKAAEKEAKR